MTTIFNYIIKNTNLDIDIEIIEYGYKLCLSSMVGTLIVLIFSILINMFKEATIFLISFSFLRKFSGGYHASTYVRCNLLLLISFICCNIWIKLNIGIIGDFVTVVSLLYILKKGPIKNENRILNKCQLLKIRKKLKIVTFIYFILLYVCLSNKLVLEYSTVLTAFFMIGGDEYV